MAFKSRRSKKRFRRFNKRKVSKPIKSYVNHAINKEIETKRYRVAGATTVGAGVPLLLNLNDALFLPQGTASNQRIGNKIKEQFLESVIRLTAADTTQAVRVMMFYSSYLILSTSALAAMPTWNQPWNQDVLPVYFIYDKILNLSSTYGTIGQPENKIIKIRRKLRQTVSYGGSTGDTVKGFLYFWVMSDSAAAAHPAIDYQFLISFQDA